jgi:hypothetical protein
MNWDAIGAIAELLGALAVFLTLIYLAIQTKNNTRAVRSAAFHQVRESFSEVSLAMLQDPSISTLLLRISNDDTSLTDDEYERFRSFLNTFVRRGESAFFQSSDGSLQLESWLGIKQTIVGVVDNEYGRLWMKNNTEGRFTKAYLAELNNELFERSSA